MKKVKQAMNIAHAIKSQFSTFKAALKAAWKIILSGLVTFAKETGELRTAKIETFTTIERTKGYARFVEIKDDGSTQFRSFRFERLVIV